MTHAWAAFDKVRFFDVADAPPATAHVSMAVTNEHRRNPTPRAERMRLVAVSRRAPRSGRRAAPPDVLPVPSDVPPFAGVGFLVQRRGVLARTVPGERAAVRADTRVPLALFSGRAAAVADRDGRAADARRTLNPFVFVEPAAGAATVDGRAALAALGLTLPLPDSDRSSEWLEWYDLCQDEATDDHRAAVWEWCDTPLFEVLTVEVSDG